MYAGVGEVERERESGVARGTEGRNGGTKSTTNFGLVSLPVGGEISAGHIHNLALEGRPQGKGREGKGKGKGGSDGRGMGKRRGRAH